MTRTHTHVHLNLSHEKFEVCELGEDFCDTHTLTTEACTIFCSADQLRQLKTVLDSYLAGLPVVVDPERKEEDSQIHSEP